MPPHAPARGGQPGPGHSDNNAPHSPGDDFCPLLSLPCPVTMSTQDCPDPGTFHGCV